MDYVAYYRVSTKMQGINGNGIKAQKQIVEDFTQPGDSIIACFREVESGGNDNRPQLKKAVQLCKDESAQLLVAKLDRLSRSISFLFTLKEELEQAGIGFVFADNPDMANNTMMLGVMASVAEDERKRIKKRIEEGIHQTETYKNKEWGNPQNFSSKGRKKGVETIKRNAEESMAWKQAFEFIRYRRELKDWSYKKIAKALNREGYRTRKDNKFHPATVRRIYLKFSKLEGTPIKNPVEMKPSKPELINAAQELNTVMGLEPPIDTQADKAALKAQLKEAAQIIMESDDISDATEQTLDNL